MMDPTSPESATAPPDKHIVDTVNHLLHLANDLCLAYGTAIRRTDDPKLRESLTHLDRSHDRCRAELGDWLNRAGFKAAQSGDVHGLLERVRVVIGDLQGDTGILKAMATNEAEMSSALRQAKNEPGMPEEVRAIIVRGLSCETDHEGFYNKSLGRFLG